MLQNHHLLVLHVQMCSALSGGLQGVLGSRDISPRHATNRAKWRKAATLSNPYLSIYVPEQREIFRSLNAKRNSTNKWAPKKNSINKCFSIMF